MSSNKSEQFCQRYNEFFVLILLLAMMSFSMIFVLIKGVYGLSTVRHFVLNIELIGTGLDILLFISYELLKKMECSQVYITTISLTTAGFGFLFTLPLITLQIMPLIMNHVAQILLS